MPDKWRVIEYREPPHPEKVLVYSDEGLIHEAPLTPENVRRAHKIAAAPQIQRKVGITHTNSTTIRHGLKLD